MVSYTLVLILHVIIFAFFMDILIKGGTDCGLARVSPDTWNIWAVTMQGLNTEWQEL
jgi:hypothetical protein